MEQKRASFDRNSLPILLGLASVLIMVVISLISSFGVAIYGGVFYGIMKIFILGLPIAGGIIAYIDNRNLVSFEVLFNAAILAVSLIAF